MVVEVTIQLDGKSQTVEVCNGCFLYLETFQSLSVQEQKDIAPSIETELKDFISSKQSQANKAKKLSTKLYTLLSNEDFRTKIKETYEKEIEEKNTRKDGKPRKQKLTKQQEFDVKNAVIDDIAKLTAGAVGIWNSYNYWQVNADLNVSKAKQNLQLIAPLLVEDTTEKPDWLEEALMDLKTNKGK